MVKKATKPVKKNTKPGRKAQVSSQPGKKRGRPSKADIAAREAEKLARENQEKEQLRLAQQQPNKTEVKVFPIFNVGQRVQQINALLIEGVDRNKGDVVRQDVGSPLVFVAWDDGSKYWTHAVCLEPEPQKVRKTRGK